MEGHVVRILMPELVMFHFRIPGLARLGPLEENDEIVEVGDVLTMVPLK